jgi:hypothetical protein
MRLNRARHFLLKKLSEKFINNNENPNKNADVVGLSLHEIDLLLRRNKKNRELILSELEKSGEIVYYNLMEKGCFIEPINGLSAFAEKKYLRKNNDIIINFLKNFVQIFIPIASMIIAYLALTIKLDVIEKSYKIKNIELEIKNSKK